MKIKNQIAFYLSCLRKIRTDLKQLRKGQKFQYDLLQLSHRLEKGLLIKNPKPMWGWEKAFRIIELLQKDVDVFYSTTANAVLSAFLKAKSKSEYQEDREKYEDFLRTTGYQSVLHNGLGGVQTVYNPDFTPQEKETVRRLFNTRHSCREYASRHVSDKDINEAVQMALRCPSACNRQPFRVYFIDPTKLVAKLGRDNLQYSGSRTLVITGDLRAFTPNEILDWFISPSIFVGYLTLSLHSLGIGSCVVRKDLVKSNAYNNAIRDITGMEESECIVLELFVGYYKDQYETPVSNRKTVENVIKFI